MEALASGEHMDVLIIITREWAGVSNLGRTCPDWYTAASLLAIIYSCNHTCCFGWVCYVFMGWWEIMINWLLWCCRDPTEFSDEPRVLTPWLLNKYKLDPQREGQQFQRFLIRYFYLTIRRQFLQVTSFRSPSGLWQMLRDVANMTGQRTWAFTSGSVGLHETSEISDDTVKERWSGVLTWSELQSCVLNKNSMRINEQW